MPKIKNIISADEIAEFRDSVKNVKPLVQKRHAPNHKPKPSPKPKIIHDKSEKILADNLFPTVDAEETLNFSSTGLQHKLLRQLKKGQFHIDAELDLHGMNSCQALNALLKFIEQCQKQQFRYVKIIHGKGQRGNNEPVLKNRVNNWLRQLPEVLAFHSAKNFDGGTGALYVLLKLKKN